LELAEAPQFMLAEERCPPKSTIKLLVDREVNPSDFWLTGRSTLPIFG